MTSDLDTTASQLVDKLGDVLTELRPASRWALGAAIMAMETDGVAGALVVKVPRKTSDLLDVSFVAGPCRMMLEN